MAYLSRKEPPRTVDVFHFLSLLCDPGAFIKMTQTTTRRT